MTVIGFAVAPAISLEEGVRLCVKLGLVETMRHGSNEYTRFTRDGYNVLATLMQLAEQYADAERDGSGPLRAS